MDINMLGFRYLRFAPLTVFIVTSYVEIGPDIPKRKIVPV